jgi:hypothetical protein
MPSSTLIDAEQAIQKLATAIDDRRLTINSLDDGSGVVLDVDGEQMLTANATGILIIQSIAEGRRSLNRIAEQISERFDVESDRARSDAAAFVSKVAAGL